MDFIQEHALFFLVAFAPLACKYGPDKKDPMIANVQTEK